MKTRILTGLLFLVWGGVAAQQTSKKSDLTAFFFLSVDCPISQKYIGEIQKIDSLFHDQITIRAIVPGKVNSTDLDNFIREYHILFPIENDENFRLVKQFHAAITPEVFLVGSQDYIYYHGAIDDWFFDLGKYRQQVTEHYLIDAISAVTHNLTPLIRETKAVGCTIQLPRTRTSTQK